MKLYIAFDFDGILVEHAVPEIGKPIEQNIELLKFFAGKGDVIIIWTGRYGKLLDEMKDWLDKNQIPYNYINENPDVDKHGYSRKIFADVYFDDRNIIIPFKIKKDIPYTVEEVLEEIKE